MAHDLPTQYSFDLLFDYGFEGNSMEYPQPEFNYHTCPTCHRPIAPFNPQPETNAYATSQFMMNMPAVQPPREVTEIPHRLWAAGRTIRPATGVNTIEFTRFDGAPIMASDVLNENYDGLLCSNEEMLFRGPSIYLRFEWPGYESWFRAIKTASWARERRPITGAKLCHEIARALQTFVERVKEQSVDAENVIWKVGTNGIDFNDIAIISLQPVSKGSWQAVFGVVR